MSNQIDKYRQLAKVIANNHYEGGYAEQAAFYFKNIQRLNADLLISQIEQLKQIKALEDRLGLIREQQRFIEIENNRIIEESSEEIILKEFSCNIKDCGKKFEKQSGVILHHLLVHQTNKINQKNIFKLELQSQENLI